MRDTLLGMVWLGQGNEDVPAETADTTTNVSSGPEVDTDTNTTGQELDDLSQQVDVFSNLETQTQKESAAQYLLDGLAATDAVHGFILGDLLSGEITDYLVVDDFGRFKDVVGDGMKGMIIERLLSAEKSDFFVYDVQFKSIADFLKASRLVINDPTITSLEDAKLKVELGYDEIQDIEEDIDTVDVTAAKAGDIEILDNDEWVTMDQFLNAMEYYPDVDGQCSGNLRRRLRFLKNKSCTNMRIGALSRAEIHGTAFRKRAGLETDPTESQSIAAMPTGLKDVEDFSDSDQTDSQSMVDRIKAMDGNIFSLVFTKTDSQGNPLRWYGNPGHAAPIMKVGDEYLVHDPAFKNHSYQQQGYDNIHVFPLKDYLDKLVVDWYTTESWVHKSYCLDACASWSYTPPAEDFTDPTSAIPA